MRIKIVCVQGKKNKKIISYFIQFKNVRGGVYFKMSTYEFSGVHHHLFVY